MAVEIRDRPDKPAGYQDLVGVSHLIQNLAGLRINIFYEDNYTSKYFRLVWNQRFFLRNMR
jgi:hypothetical protein